MSGNRQSARLRELGWVVPVPAVWAAEHDDEVILAWLGRDCPRIKKKLAVEAP
jgi:hypothetical protein